MDIVIDFINSIPSILWLILAILAIISIYFNKQREIEISLETKEKEEPLIVVGIFLMLLWGLYLYNIIQHGENGIVWNINDIIPSIQSIINLLIYIVIFIYFLPTIIVLLNEKKKRKFGIIIINILLWWTSIGWLIALILSLGHDHEI